MTKAQLVQKLADSAGVSKKEAGAMLQGLVDTVVKSVKKGDPVKIPDLGTFRKVHSKARMGRNPQTQEPVKIKATKKARITPLKAFKDAVVKPSLAPKLARGVWPPAPTKKAAAKTTAKKTTAKKTAASRGPATKSTAKKSPTKSATKATAKKATARR